jgi:acyl dehydratase
MNEVWKKPPVSLETYQGMVGKEIGVSSWHLIDQGRIDTYAGVIEDHQFIHVDPDRARKETAFGTTIAHGFLTMSLMSIMSYEVMPVVEGTAMGVNYGFDKLRFLSPVCSGKRVRGRFVLAEATLRKPKELLSRTNVTVDRGRGEARAGRRLARLDLFQLVSAAPLGGLDPAIHRCSKRLQLSSRSGGTPSRLVEEGGAIERERDEAG